MNKQAENLFEMMSEEHGVDGICDFDTLIQNCRDYAKMRALSDVCNEDNTETRGQLRKHWTRVIELLNAVADETDALTQIIHPDICDEDAFVLTDEEMEDLYESNVNYLKTL